MAEVTVPATKVSIDLNSLTDDLAKLEGLPPYGFNPCQGDGYFAKAMERKYGLSIGQLKEIRNREVGKP